MDEEYDTDWWAALLFRGPGIERDEWSSMLPRVLIVGRSGSGKGAS